MTMFGAAGAGSGCGKQRMEIRGIPEAASSRFPGSVVALASAPGNPSPSDIPSRLGGGERQPRLSLQDITEKTPAPPVPLPITPNPV